jgi:uroporphyrinogen III methyltransferase/synthase
MSDASNAPHNEYTAARLGEATQDPHAVVYLVGAGPGDPGLLTLRAKALLEDADVVVYDYLANDAVVRFANPAAERHFVGKKGFSHHVTQPEINDLLVELARTGGPRRIVRLKGGDPFVFGRGGEEALALVEAGIAFEVVPGVTAGVAAPAYAGIPVTHRTMASQVTLVTGHETPHKDEPVIDWKGLAAGTGTLCFYMGIRDLPTIARRLIENGRPKSTPVALVRWGTTPAQETLVSTLDTVVQDADRAHFQAPAIIVVGEVVNLRQDLRWFDARPLFGKRVVVTRSRAQASRLSGMLAALGADVVEFPTIEVAPRPLDAHMRADIARLASDATGAREVYDWVVFTSANGVACFFDLLTETGHDARIFGDVKVAAIGPATAAALAAYGIAADVVPDRFVAESVADALLAAGVTRGTSVLIPRASVARDTLPDALAAAGADVHVMPAYDTVRPEADEATRRLAADLRDGAIDAVTFTSSSTARNFCQLLATAVEADRIPGLLEGVTCASIGPVTSDTMRSLGIPVSVEADRYTIPGLVSALQTALD